MIKLKLSGFSEFDRLLKNLPKNIDSRVVQKATTGAIREGRKEIKKNAPRSSGKQSPSSKKYGQIFRNLRIIKLKRVARNERAARIDTGKSFWALWQELGNRHQEAKPFFEPAFYAAREKIIDNLRRRLSIGIDKEIRKLK